MRRTRRYTILTLRRVPSKSIALLVPLDICFKLLYEMHALHARKSQLSGSELTARRLPALGWETRLRPAQSLSEPGDQGRIRQMARVRVSPARVIGKIPVGFMGDSLT